MARPLISSTDLRERAKARLPRFAFDYIDGGAGEEDALARSRRAYRETCLRPRVLVNSAEPANLSHRFLNRDWALPFGIAPLGLPGLAWPGADLAMARAAEAAGAPFVTATPGTATLETVRAAAPTRSAFQLYVGAATEITDDLVARAERAGYDTLIVTADVPRAGKRLRDLRNGFGLPLRITPRLAMDLALHPRWSLATWRAGAPHLINFAAYADDGAGAQTLAQLMARQSSGRLDWAVLARIRDRWSGALVLKGVLDPEDAARAVGAGVDAIQVSNHGGRQLDGAPATLDALRAIREALPADVPLAVDGGVRSGEDILKALEAGADFVFLGRPFLYAVAAEGAAGPAALFDMLAAELEAAMAQTGRRSIAGIRRCATD
ncbi:FMN-dependent alpha-hydroxy acid dehydrogenase [Roseivivax marinus]|uniref:FMN-dependent alpha-hydroxy acid dehydrogenase n=1 Tax=Roseivivax marinus TaxID=1379903 RepID=W4HGY5_9RHOB|nr:alpha-hydroxy acid oxidase [Roseivivax marinus]ETW11391.1 FMN-dependent alpha-hydroxy acid dehydrogenase [Roseivivax marinus]